MIHINYNNKVANIETAKYLRFNLFKVDDYVFLALFETAISKELASIIHDAMGNTGVVVAKDDNISLTDGIITNFSEDITNNTTTLEIRGKYTVVE